MGGLNWLRDLPIRRKLAFISILTSSVALLLAGSALLAFEQRSARSALVERLSITAAMVADSTASALTFDDAAAAIRTLRGLSADPHIATAVVFDPAGRPFASYTAAAPRRDAVPAPAATGYSFAGRSLRMWRNVDLAGERAGSVYLEYDLAEMYARLRRYVLVMLAVAAVASAASLLLADRLHALISRPMSHLAQVVGMVSAQKDYSARAVKRGNDELGRLIDGFNTMLTQIQLQDNALEEARHELEQRVALRTAELQAEVAEHKRAQAELERVHRQLLDASRQAGMAEVATNVLHNVGNVLNSVNVSATLVADLAHNSKAAGLGRVAALLREHQHDLGEFITHDSHGRHVPAYLGHLAQHLQYECETTISELDELRANVGHIKDIVAMQQDYARVSGMTEIVGAAALVEDSLRIDSAAMARHGIEVIRDFAGDPLLNVDKHKVLQILVNLVRNAKHACEESTTTPKRVTVSLRSDATRVRVAVTDNGVGIAAETLKRVFNHGFTTRATGHGFGLHSGALAARELGGRLSGASAGLGCGATFTLELPLYVPAAATAQETCSA